jgi:hypothetical protein
VGFVSFHLPCETGESTVKKREMMVMRVSLEAAIIEEGLELYFLTLCSGSTIDPCIIFQVFFFSFEFFILFVVLFVGGV